jgi:hypothetical protein
MTKLGAFLFPDEPRRLPGGRSLNIGLRTAHLLAASILLGGHVFAVSADQLIAWLWLTILTGAGLIFQEMYRSFRWAYQLMGVLVEVKLVLILAAGVFWDQRVPLLMLVIVLGSVGSHLPARYRHFSFVHGRVLEDPKRVAVRPDTR